MRIIDVCAAPIRAVAVSPDGRLAAVSAEDGWLGLCDLLTGAARGGATGPECDQFAFAPDGRWAVYAFSGGLCFDPLDDSAPTAKLPGSFAGGVAVSADGRKLLAVQNTVRTEARLAAWELPSLRPQIGFDGWPPFRRLAVSRNGEFLAGVWPGLARPWQSLSAAFELRFAKSGGLDYRHRPFDRRPAAGVGFVSFTHDSAACAFGWDTELRVLDLSTGTSKVVRETPVETRRSAAPFGAGANGEGENLEYRAPYRDAAFTGSGRHLATVEQPDRWKRWYPAAGAWRLSAGADPTCLLRFRDVQAWQVVREYDWQCGPLTCLAFTADGSAGVCGTADGRLVQFDVDE